MLYSTLKFDVRREIFLTCIVTMFQGNSYRWCYQREFFTTSECTSKEIEEFSIWALHLNFISRIKLTMWLHTCKTDYPFDSGNLNLCYNSNGYNIHWVISVDQCRLFMGWIQIVYSVDIREICLIGPVRKVICLMGTFRIHFTRWDPMNDAPSPMF